MKGNLTQWLQERGIDAEFVNTGADTSTVAKSSENLGIKRDEIVKSIVFESDKGVIMVWISGDKRISKQKLKAATNATRLKMARPELVEEYTGYTIGGVPPVSHAKEHEMLYILNREVLDKDWVYAGGGDDQTLLKLKAHDLLLLKPRIAEVEE